MGKEILEVDPADLVFTFSGDIDVSKINTKVLGKPGNGKHFYLGKDIFTGEQVYYDKEEKQSQLVLGHPR